MLKQFLVYLLLSILVVVFAKYAHLLIVSIDMFYVYINTKLIPIFNQTSLGLSIRRTLVLMLIPITLTAIPALGYKVIRGGNMPHYIVITWMIWTVIVLSDALIRLG
jgi:hypothetical protein